MKTKVTITIKRRVVILTRGGEKAKVTRLTLWYVSAPTSAGPMKPVVVPNVFDMLIIRPGEGMNVTQLRHNTDSRTHRSTHERADNKTMEERFLLNSIYFDI